LSCLQSWQPAVQPVLLESLASRTAGYCGADLRALCSEAVLRAVRRTYPQV
jgi:SpoVK/Ycf46/Vps4 family AAA+-type ATPase